MKNVATFELISQRVLPACIANAGAYFAVCFNTVGVSFKLEVILQLVCFGHYTHSIRFTKGVIVVKRILLKNLQVM